MADPREEARQEAERILRAKWPGADLPIADGIPGTARYNIALDLLAAEIAARQKAEDERDKAKRVYADGVRVALKAGRGIEKAARDLDTFDATAVGQALNAAHDDILKTLTEEHAAEIATLREQLAKSDAAGFYVSAELELVREQLAAAEREREILQAALTDEQRRCATALAEGARLRASLEQAFVPLEGLSLPGAVEWELAPPVKKAIADAATAVRDALSSTPTSAAVLEAIDTLRKAAELTVLHFQRQDVSGNFQGDDEHEAWGALNRAARGPRPPRAPRTGGGVAMPRRAHDFRVGQRVRMTEEAFKAGVRRRELWSEGVVTTAARGGRPDHFINVRIDGHKRAGHYHVDFWEPIP